MCVLEVGGQVGRVPQRDRKRGGGGRQTETVGQMEPLAVLVCEKSTSEPGGDESNGMERTNISFLKTLL